jgi:hypothetical protein
LRIGSLPSLVFSKYDRSEPRDIVTKQVPGYVQALQFDLVSASPTIQIDGVLVGTSNSNLASQIETLKAIYRTKRLVWIDASDQYPQLVDFVRITKLQGPTLDASKGPNVAAFSLEAVPLLPWGTTLPNPYSTTSGVILRDLSGVGLEYILNPLSMNCNYTPTASGTQGNSAFASFSWEFVVDNQNAYNSPNYITTCNATTGFSVLLGSSVSLNSDSIVYRKPSTAAVEAAGISDSSGNLEIQYTSGSAQNISSYDFFCLWARSDFGGNSSGTIQVILQSSSGNYYQWNYTSLTAYEWYRLVIPLRAPPSTTGAPSLSSIVDFIINSGGKASSADHLWVDDMETDTGKAVYLEFQIPDNPSQAQGASAFNFTSYHSGGYSVGGSGDVFGNQAGCGSVYFLDGTLDSNIYSTGYDFSFFGPANMGQSGIFAPTNCGVGGSITYSTTYGTQNRFAIAIKMPPATSDSVSGDLPSNDP